MLLAPLEPSMLKGLPRRALAQLARHSSGIACAMLTAALCALGGVLLELVPDFYRYRLWNSWSAPRWHTAWVYVLLAVVAVWCLHAILHLHDSVKNPVKPPAKSRSRLGVAVAQLGLVLAFGTYVWLVVGTPAETFLVTEKGTDIHGEFYRALRIEPGSREETPPRRTAVWLERRVGTVSDQFRVERGRFWASVAGTHQLVLARVDMSTDVAVLRRGHEQVELSTAKPLKEGEDTLLFQGHEHSDRVPHAELKSSGRATPLPLDPEWAGENAFLGLKESPVFLLRVHRNLAMQLAVIAAALLLGAILLLWHGRSAARSAK